MAGIQDLISQLPVDRIAEMLGIDVGTAEKATNEAVPALVEGMRANAQDPGGAASLAQALDQHAQRVGEAGLDIRPDNVDTTDGQKIVNHVFGDKTDQVANQLGSLGGGGELFKKLLPMLAPIVMAFLAKNVLGGRKATNTAGAASQYPNQADESGGGLLDSLKDAVGGLFGKKDEPADTSTRRREPAAQDDGGLGGLLGGSGGGGLSDMLGGLLGGGSGSSGSGQGGGLGDLLGGLLGGGRRQ